MPDEKPDEKPDEEPEDTIPDEKPEDSTNCRDLKGLSSGRIYLSSWMLSAALHELHFTKTKLVTVLTAATSG